MSSLSKILGVAGGVRIVILIGIIGYGEMTRSSRSGFLEVPTEHWKVGYSLKEKTRNGIYH